MNRLESTAPDSAEAKACASLLNIFAKEIAKLEALMENPLNIFRKSPQKSHYSIPCPVLGLTAASIFAGHGDLFKARSELVAFSGLNPLSKTSGSSVRRKGRMSKHDLPEVRRVLSLAISAVVNKCSGNNAFKTKHERIRTAAICAGCAKCSSSPAPSSNQANLFLKSSLK